MRDRRLLIYGLIDPRTRLIRYIGQTMRGIQRSREHRYPSCPDTYCRRWVKKLQLLGLDYEVAVLEIVEVREQLSDAECWWIAYGRACGWPLCARKRAESRKRAQSCACATRLLPLAYLQRWK